MGKKHGGLVNPLWTLETEAKVHFYPFPTFSSFYMKYPFDDAIFVLRKEKLADFLN